MRVLAVVLAGGQGHRFWPRSSESLPKQFLRLFGEESLLQATVSRLGRFLPPESTFVVTTSVYETLVREHVPNLPPENIICEPVGRDTAAAMGYALTMIGAEDPETVAVILPADHHIDGVEAWTRAIGDACRAALHGRPVLIGIPPARAETAYGYLLLGEELPELAGQGGTRFARVSRFVEKPDRGLAGSLLKEGRCLWNSGMFIWKISTALDLIQRHLPDTYAILSEIARARSGWGVPFLDSPAWRARAAGLFAGIRPVSIDYGVMEKERDVVVALGEFGWDDMGSWEGLSRFLPRDQGGNTVRGEVVLQDSRGCIVDWDGGPAVIIGLRDAVIAGGSGPLLACAREKLGDLKSVLAGQGFRHVAARLENRDNRSGPGDGPRGEGGAGREDGADRDDGADREDGSS